ncbi:hypothetical protein BG006_002592 [Podila minutissima]|uniref:Resolvase/invertase-type recombinase catalytic domain-containing protein n=1 Tax=Podila minutissima TaxID=64525 RepID=A0A9P5SCV7_9FUNG|nr:hypothetical protein BG006_002592 [Podila minutissima]
MVDPAYSITFEEVKEILASYTAISSIDAGYSSTFVILGPMIHVLVADETNLEKLKDALEAKALGYLEEDDGVHTGIPLVPMGQLENMMEIYQERRTDRGSGSAVINAANAPPIRAVTNLQSFKFTVVSSRSDINKTAPSLSDDVTEILQSVILYLIPMLLLTPAQARELLIDLIENKAGAGTKKWPLVCKDFQWHSEFGGEVPDCLSDFPDTFPSLAALQEFHRCPMALFARQQCDQYWIAIERCLAKKNCYIVLAFTGRECSAPPGTNGRSWRLSVEGDRMLQAAVALPRPVALQLGGYLLAFVDIPSEEEIIHAMDLIAPNIPMRFHTLPTQYSHMVNNQRLFRIDGFMKVHIWDRQPANAVRVAKSSEAADVEDGHAQGHAQGDAQGNAHEPHPDMLQLANHQTCVIYIRCSHESQGDASTSIERQFVTTLSKLQRLVDPHTIHHLEFAVDYVSSNTKSMSSRRMLPIILGGANNTLLLSSNPDRVTRRPEEVADIVNILREKSSRWYTLGLRGHHSDWVQVSDEAQEMVQDQIRLTRQVAAQQAFYTRVVYFEIRVLNQMRPKRLRQTGQLGTVKKHCLANRLHDLAVMFDQVLVWSRVSPDRGDSKNPEAGPSIRRQRMFCQAILGIDTVKRAAYKDAIQLSAFSDAAIKALIKTIDPKMRTLVVCVSVDRLVRNVTHLEALAEFLVKGSHQIVSLLQDPLVFMVDNASKFTKDCAAEGLLHPFQTGHGAYPALAPEVWFDHELHSWTKNVLAHAQNAEEFARALPITRFQGNPQTRIPGLVTQKIPGARGFDDHRKRLWIEHARTIFPEPIVINGAFMNGTHSFRCICRLEQRHPLECLCDCKFCKAQREIQAECPCLTTNKCECLVDCNCSCEKCHKTMPKDNWEGCDSEDDYQGSDSEDFHVDDATLAEAVRRSKIAAGKRKAKETTPPVQLSSQDGDDHGSNSENEDFRDDDATLAEAVRRSKIAAGKRKAKEATPPPSPPVQQPRRTSQPASSSTSQPASSSTSQPASSSTSQPGKRPRLESSSTASSPLKSRGFCRNYTECGERTHKSSGTWCRSCYMKQYLENRLVKTCECKGCTKETHKGRWCSNHCYGIAMGSQARKCKYPGCNNISGPGFGTLCESHVTRTLKDKKRKAREEKANGSGSQ